MIFRHPPLNNPVKYFFIERNCWAFDSWMSQYQEEVEPYHSHLGYSIRFVESTPGNVIGWELFQKYKNND